MEDEGDLAIEVSARRDAPVVKLVHSVIANAVERGASDIHFQPENGDMRVRLRVDGVTFDCSTVPKQLAAAVVSRMKIMGHLDIAERRMPQDGRSASPIDGLHRPARRDPARRPRRVGRSPHPRQGAGGPRPRRPGHGRARARRDARRDRAGPRRHPRNRPTGAGKTTTLYAALSEANTPERTLITIEDPVEYELEGVKQVQVNPKTGLTFAAGLRSMVRSDPDVMMVGEIRDRETPRSRSSRRSPATSCSRPCTRTTPRWRRRA